MRQLNVDTFAAHKVKSQVENLKDPVKKPEEEKQNALPQCFIAPFM